MDVPFVYGLEPDCSELVRSLNVRPRCGVSRTAAGTGMLSRSITRQGTITQETTMQDLILYPGDGAEQPTIGIDVSKKLLDLSPEPTLPSSLANLDRVCRSFARRLRKINPRVVAVEATGGYEKTLVQALLDHDVPVAVLQPNRVRAYAKSCGQLAKTDRLDAANIASYARAVSVRLAQKPSPEAEQLRVLCDRREQVVQDRVRELGRLEAVRDKSMCREITRHIKQLKKIEVGLDARIQTLIDETESLRSKNDVLRRVRGIGPVIASTLLCLLPELGYANRQSIAALGGLAPYANESGQRRGRRSIFGGRAQIRRALYLAAFTNVRYAGPLRDHYRSMVRKGKPKKVALIAIARKILVCVNVRMTEHLASLEEEKTGTILT